MADNSDPSHDWLALDDEDRTVFRRLEVSRVLWSADSNHHPPIDGLKAGVFLSAVAPFGGCTAWSMNSSYFGLGLTESQVNKWHRNINIVTARGTLLAAIPTRGGSPIGLNWLSDETLLVTYGDGTCRLHAVSGAEIAAKTIPGAGKAVAVAVLSTPPPPFTVAVSTTPTPPSVGIAVAFADGDVHMLAGLFAEATFSRVASGVTDVVCLSLLPLGVGDGGGGTSAATLGRSVADAIAGGQVVALVVSRNDTSRGLYLCGPPMQAPTEGVRVRIPQDIVSIATPPLLPAWSNDSAGGAPATTEPSEECEFMVACATNDGQILTATAASVCAALTARPPRVPRWRAVATVGAYTYTEADVETYTGAAAGGPPAAKGVKGGVMAVGQTPRPLVFAVAGTDGTVIAVYKLGASSDHAAVGPAAFAAEDGAAVAAVLSQSGEVRCWTLPAHTVSAYGVAEVDGVRVISVTVPPAAVLASLKAPHVRPPPVTSPVAAANAAIMATMGAAPFALNASGTAGTHAGAGASAAAGAICAVAHEEVCERVSKATTAALRPSSLDPSAVLLAVFVDLRHRRPAAIEHLRALISSGQAGRSLADGVRTLLTAAVAEVCPLRQQQLLCAASYGAVFLPRAPAEMFVSACLRVRVLNFLSGSKYVLTDRALAKEVAAAVAATVEGGVGIGGAAAHASSRLVAPAVERVEGATLGGVAGLLSRGIGASNRRTLFVGSSAASSSARGDAVALAATDSSKGILSYAREHALDLPPSFAVASFVPAVPDPLGPGAARGVPSRSPEITITDAQLNSLGFGWLLQRLTARRSGEMYAAAVQLASALSVRAGAAFVAVAWASAKATAPTSSSIPDEQLALLIKDKLQRTCDRAPGAYASVVRAVLSAPPPIRTQVALLLLAEETRVQQMVSLLVQMGRVDDAIARAASVGSADVVVSLIRRHARANPRLVEACVSNPQSTVRGVLAAYARDSRNDELYANVVRAAGDPRLAVARLVAKACGVGKVASVAAVPAGLTPTERVLLLREASAALPKGSADVPLLMVAEAAAVAEKAMLGDKPSSDGGMSVYGLLMASLRPVARDQNVSKLSKDFELNEDLVVGARIAAAVAMSNFGLVSAIVNEHKSKQGERARIAVRELVLKQKFSEASHHVSKILPVGERVKYAIMMSTIDPALAAVALEAAVASSDLNKLGSVAKHVKDESIRSRAMELYRAGSR